MKGDFSRFTFDAGRHAHGLLMQQGRVQLDADFNELQAIQQHRVETETVDVIGPTGYPKAGGGFQISVQGGNQLRIGKGRYYVDGLMVANDLDPCPIDQQPYLPGAAQPAAAGLYLAYLDVFLLNRTVLDLPEIREVALNGVDTATREVTAWQVKFLRLGNDTDSLTCTDPMPAWDRLNGLARGTLAARARFGTAAEDPCTLAPGAAFRGTENQLYRVEIHRGGPATTATFKWSRDNGSLVAAWEATTAAQQIRVGSTGRGGLPGFTDRQWIELVDDTNELYDDTAALIANPAGQNGNPGTLVRISKVNGNELVLDSAPGQPGTETPKVRAWDMATDTGAIPVSEFDPADGFYELEDGIQIKFDQAATYVAGDYWLIPARTVTADVEWPQEGGNPKSLAPHGVVHHRTKLALVKSADGAAWSMVEDCRLDFPSLTTICAEDVCFDDTTCKLDGAATVQQAIDKLCQMRGEICTHIAVPGAGWESVFNDIAAGEHAHVCFVVGDYEVEKPVVVQGRGNLTLTGSGPGTRLSVKDGESVLVFQQCAGVTVRDLALTGGLAQSMPRTHLAGALTTADCPRVTVEHVQATSAPFTSRQTSCFNIGASANQDGVVGAPVSARIAHCDLTVGEYQIGILLTNVARAQVTDNTVRLRPGRATEDPKVWVADPDALGRLRRLLIASANFDGSPPGRPGMVSIGVSRGNSVVNFLTPNVLEGVWDTAIEIDREASVTPKQIYDALIRAANRLLRNEGNPDLGSQVRNWLTNLLKVDRPVGSEAIVIGGRMAEEVRIRDNTIDGFMQGIRVGVSHRRNNDQEAAGIPADRDSAKRVIIEANSIGLVMPAQGVRERYGIYVGNVDSAVINDNYVSADTQSLKETAVDGIHIYGQFGRRIIVGENHIEGCRIGVRFHPLNPADPNTPAGIRRTQWLVEDNIAVGSAPALLIEPNQNDPRVRQVNNLS